MGEVTIVLVDDEEIVRAGLRLLLDGTDGIRVVGEAADGLAALDEIARRRPDVILMDIRMPRMNGITATREVLRRDPGARIIVLTTFDADAEVLGALESGAHGYLLKDTPPRELIAAVHHVAQGRMSLSPTITRQVVAAATRPSAAGPDPDAVARIARLSPREREVADAVARGLANGEIARELHLSLPTVKTHVRRIMEKLPADNRTQIAICVREGSAD